MTDTSSKITEKEQSPQAKAMVRAGVKTLQEKGKKDRDLYLMWRGIPALLRTLDEKEMSRMGYNVDDPIFMRLVRIKTRREFCEAFKIGINQPGRWEEDPEFVAKIHQVSVNEHVMKFKKDVDFSFTQKTIRHGDAHRMKLWKQLFEGWTEKTVNANLNINMTPADLVADIEARNAKIRQKE